MWPDRRLIELFEIELPIVLAPMAGAMDFELAAAVARSGRARLAALRDAQCRSRCASRWRNSAPARKKPINLNFFCHTAAGAQQRARGTLARAACALLPRACDRSGGADAVQQPHGVRRRDVRRGGGDAGPQVVSFHFGLPDARLMERVKAAGCMIMSSATTVAEARWLDERGVDAVIAQGIEAGGHRGIFLTDDLATQVGTFALVPQIVDAVKVPVIAAGAITDARGIAAAFALGAAGVQIGSAYLWSPESQDFGAASRGAQERARRRHRADQSDDRAAGARHRQPRDARDRADLGCGARVSARGGRAGAAARQGGGARLGRFLADVGGAGGRARPRAAGGRIDAQACRGGAGADAKRSRRADRRGFLVGWNVMLSVRPRASRDPDRFTCSICEESAGLPLARERTERLGRTARRDRTLRRARCARACPTGPRSRCRRRYRAAARRPARAAP